MKKFINVLMLTFICFFCFNIMNIHASEKLNNKSSLYMWNLKDINYSSFDKVNKYLDIDTIYLGSYRNFYDFEHTLYFEYAENNNLTSYIVYGEKYENQDQILIEIKNLIDKIYAYNSTSTYKIKGIAIDSEFHATDVYRKANLDKKKEIFAKYIEIMKEAKLYANNKGLKYVACIPWNYDTNISEYLLEELIKDGCDSFQIMNYTKKNSIVNISKEIELAIKYNKKVESIAELKEPGSNEITDIITFWNDGLDACTNKFKEIENYYNYHNLSFTYHHLTPILSLYKKIDDYNNYYDYKLYPKDNNNNNSISISDLYLTDNANKIKGLHIFDIEKNEHLIYYYGLKFNNTYYLESDNYITNDNIVKNIINNNRVIEDEKIFKIKKITQNDNISSNNKNDDNIIIDIKPNKEQKKDKVNEESNNKYVMNNNYNNSNNNNFKKNTTYTETKNNTQINDLNDNNDTIENTKENEGKIDIQKKETINNKKQKVRVNFLYLLLIILFILIIVVIRINKKNYK